MQKLQYVQIQRFILNDEAKNKKVIQKTILFSACAQTRVGYHLPTAWAATR